MRNLNWTKLSLIISILILSGCKTVDITKTGKGFHEETNPANIEILITKPDRNYIELATVSTTGWKPKQTAKMHNALRADSAPLGASAVILTSSGILNNGKLWTTGVAIKYTD